VPGANSELVVHDVAPDGTVAPTGRVLFNLTSIRIQGYYPVPGYDVAPDGQRFVFVQVPDVPLPPPVSHVSLIQNWLDELKANVPVR